MLFRANRLKFPNVFENGFLSLSLFFEIFLDNIVWSHQADSLKFTHSWKFFIFGRSSHLPKYIRKLISIQYSTSVLKLRAFLSSSRQAASSEFFHRWHFAVLGKSSQTGKLIPIQCSRILSNTMSFLSFETFSPHQAVSPCFAHQPLSSQTIF